MQVVFLCKGNEIFNHCHPDKVKSILTHPGQIHWKSHQAAKTCLYAKLDRLVI